MPYGASRAKSQLAPFIGAYLQHINVTHRENTMELAKVQADNFLSRAHEMIIREVVFCMTLCVRPP